jgi:hypothetical protein
MRMEQNGSSLFKIDNDSITFFIFFLSEVGIDTVSIPTYQIIVIDIVIDSITLKMYEKMFTFMLSNRYPYIADNVWKKSSLLRYRIDRTIIDIIIDNIDINKK